MQYTQHCNPSQFSSLLLGQHDLQAILRKVGGDGSGKVLWIRDRQTEKPIQHHISRNEQRGGEVKTASPCDKIYEDETSPRDYAVVEQLPWEGERFRFPVASNMIK